MRRFSIVCSIVLLVVIGATAAIVAQQAVAASSGNDKPEPAAGQEADAPAAQKGLVLDSLAKGDMVAAEAACRALLDAPTPHALHELVEEAQALDKLPEVRQFYQNMIAARPDDPQVIWLKTALAIANVHLADDKAVEAMLQNIAAGHGSDDRAAEAFGQIAWAYRKGQQYDKALSINQYTVDHWPQKDRAAYAQQGIVLCRIALGDLAAADEALDILIEKFGTDADASKLVLWSAFGYQDAGQKDKAYEVYERVVEHYPETPEAATAQVRLAVAAVEAGDPDWMERTIPPVLAQFEPTPDNGERLSYLANGLFWKHMAHAGKRVEQTDLVAAIDGYIEAIADTTLAAWPQSDWALTAQRDLAVVAIQRGDDSTADVIVQKMLMEYADRARLSEAVQTIGEDYYYRALQLPLQELIEIAGPSQHMRDHLAKAIAKWKLIVERMPPDAPAMPTTHYLLARAYYHLGDFRQAETYCATLVQQWPAHEFAWQAQFLIANMAKRTLVEKKPPGKLPEKEAVDKVTIAFEQLLRDFPNCPGADVARNWVTRHSASSRGGAR